MIKERRTIENVLLLFVFAVAIVGAVMSFVNEEMFLHQMVGEDGPVEWLTVVGLLFCFGLSLSRFAAGRRAGRNAAYLAGLSLAAAVFLFGAGEEISWGQRLFGVESPEFFRQNNSQYETNIHNLVVGGTNVNKLVFGKILAVIILSFVFVLPWLWSRVAKIRDLAARWAVPVPRWKHGLLYLALLPIILPIESSKRGELLEFAGSFMFFLIFLNPINASIYRIMGNLSEEEGEAVESVIEKQAA